MSLLSLCVPVNALLGVINDMRVFVCVSESVCVCL